MTAALGRSFSSLSVPNYRRYFAGQVVSLAGNWMQIVAEVWLDPALTGNGRSSASPPPAVPPILLAGRVGRPPRRPHPEAPAAHVTQALMALPALTLWALTASGVVRRGSCSPDLRPRVVNAFDNPARQSFVVEMVGADRVVNASRSTASSSTRRASSGPPPRAP